MSRKLVLLVAVCLCLAPLAFGAGGQEKASTGPVKLTWFAPMSAGPELDLWKLTLIPDFEKKNPNIKVDQSVEVWADYWQKIAVMFAGGQFPDLVWMHYSYFKDYAQQNMLQPLDEVMSKDKTFDVNDYVAADDERLQAPRQAVRHAQGPRRHGDVVQHRHARRGRCEKAVAGLEVERLSRDRHQDDQGHQRRRPDRQWGSADLFGADPANWWHHEQGWDMIKSNGGDTYSEDFKQAFIDKPETVEAIQFMADVINKYKVAPKSEQIAGLGDPFAIGKVAMCGLRPCLAGLQHPLQQAADQALRHRVRPCRQGWHVLRPRRHRLCDPHEERAPQGGLGARQVRSEQGDGRKGGSALPLGRHPQGPVGPPLRAAGKGRHHHRGELAARLGRLGAQAHAPMSTSATP